jgi:hypothetical protein
MISFGKKNENSTPVGEAKSKRKTFMIGFTICVAISGLTLFGSTLSAVAKYGLPNNNKAPFVPATNNSYSYYLPNAATVGYLVLAGYRANDKVAFAVGTTCGLIICTGIKYILKK